MKNILEKVGETQESGEAEASNFALTSMVLLRHKN